MDWNPESLTQEKLNTYRAAAEQAWGDDTRHERYIGHPQPSAGQCYVTSRWLTTKLGGSVGSKDGHYVWVSPDKQYVVDLTGDQFAYEPNHPVVEGLQLDAEDEPWEFPPDHKAHRPGPVMFKRITHPLYKGTRVKSFKGEPPRLKTFIQRANHALDNPEALSRTAYQGWGGDSHPGQEPQVVDRIEHDRPTEGPEHYKWVFANGRLEIDPESDYNQLSDFVGAGSDHSGPIALGTVNIVDGKAQWEATGNVGLSTLARALQEHTQQVGWEWGGVKGLNDQRLAHRMWWMEDQGHLVLMIRNPGLYDGVIDIVGRTAHVQGAIDPVREALEEWAADHHLALNTGIKTPEDVDGHNTYGPRPDYAQGPTDITPPSGTLRCPECGIVFPSFGQYILHRKEEEPQGESLDEDGHFPEMDMDKALKPHFHEREPFVFPLAKTAHKLDRHMAKIWDADDSVHLGAYVNGELVGQATINPEARYMTVTAVRYPEGVFASLVRKAQERFDHLDYPFPTKAEQIRLASLNFANTHEGVWKWAKGKEPMDLIPDSIPFIYDVDKDVIQVGQPGQNHNSVIGDFTPGGIVQGFYEPGGVVTITNQTDYPWTVRHLVDLWYWSHPHMRVTDVQYEDPMGNKQKLTKIANREVMYHIAPRQHREAIQANGLRPGWGGGQAWGSPFEGIAPLRGVYVSDIPGHIGLRDHSPWESITGGPHDVWEINTRGLHLAPDFPALTEHGAVVDGHQFYFDDDESHEATGGLDGHTVEHAMANPHPYIQLTGTAMLHEPVGPERLTLRPEGYVPTHWAKTATAIGQHVKQVAAMDPAVWKAYQALEAAGGEVFAVGGVVRDALMGKESNDVDLMVRGLHQDQVDSILRKMPGKVDITGKSFGVFRYNYKGHEVEIALPRTERSTGDRRVDFDVNIDHRLPVEDDLLRRDFTGNSIAVDLRSGRMVDPFGGADDIKNGVLRTTHPASFREDPTRILRALVMNGRYGWNPDERTRSEMAQHADALHSESWDNMNGIMDKLMKSDDPARAIRLAHETGVLKHFMPELDSIWDYDQRNPHHNFSLGDHHMHVLEGVSHATTDPDLRMAALMHDWGKPASRAMKCIDCNHVWDEAKHVDNPFQCPACGSHNTKGTFHGGDGVGHDHALVGQAMAEQRLTHMKWPVSRRKRIGELIRHHMFGAFSSPKGARKFLNNVGDHADDLMILRHADMYGKGTDEAQNEKTQVHHMAELVDQARQAPAPTALSGLAVNGRDLIQAGIPQGPQIGQVLNNLMQQVLENPELNTREALLGLAQGQMNNV
jgi:tRNA nucleotidyltransferase (CCA-adding enzyme)